MDVAPAVNATPAIRYTAEQIQVGLDTMTAGEKAKVAKIAKHFAPRSGMEWRDLYQEAFVRALDTRSCEVGTTMPAFLGGIIRSIASEGPRARRKVDKREGVEVLARGNYGDEGLAEPEDEGVPPDEAALARVFYADQLALARASYAGDEQLELLVEGVHDGMRGHELEEFLGVDTKGLAAAKKRLARRLAAGVPEGIRL